MKKSLLALSLLSAFGVASAQSSVTMYGIVDAGITYDNGSSAGTVTKLESGIESGSRLGFRGTEDLGSGLKALFVLEQGFDIDTGKSGQGGRLFGRQAWVGLNSEYGQVSAGRQYTPIFNAYGVVDPFGKGTSGDIYTLFGRASDFLSEYKRMDNSVVYTTPSSLGGFNAAVAYSFGEVAGDEKKQAQAGLSLGYNNGPLSVVYAYHKANNALAKPPASTETYQAHLVGGTYDFKVVKLHAAAEQVKHGDNHKTESYLLGATVPVGQHSLFADYTYRNDKMNDDSNSDQFAIGYNHNLSKRTNLYTILAYTTNDPKAKINVDVYGKSYKSVQLGIRHVF